MIIPDDLAKRVTAAFGQRGVDWVDRLPRLLADLRGQWQLADVGPPFPGASTSFVAPVVGPSGAHLVLKVSPAPVSLGHEALALEHWSGRGAVLLEEVDLARGALLMERAIPGASLLALAKTDDRAATEVASRVIAELKAAGAPPSELPTTESWLESLEAPFVRNASRQLQDACREAGTVGTDLLRTHGDRVVLHGDLHHGNMLSVAGERWIAADPKGLVGPREVEPAALLRNPRDYLLGRPDPVALIRDRVSVLAERLAYDAGRIVQWGFVCAVLAAAWACEDGEGDVEIGRWLSCAAAIRAAGRTTA